MTQTAANPDRLDIRLPAEARAQIETVARLSGVQVSEFTRRSLTERARAVIAAYERTVLEPVDHATLFAAMDIPEAIPALTETLRAHTDEIDRR